jgi:hypothetical protein
MVEPRKRPPRRKEPEEPEARLPAERPRRAFAPPRRPWEAAEREEPSRGLRKPERRFIREREERPPEPRRSPFEFLIPGVPQPPPRPRAELPAGVTPFDILMTERVAPEARRPGVRPEVRREERPGFREERPGFRREERPSFRREERPRVDPSRWFDIRKIWDDVRARRRDPRFREAAGILDIAPATRDMALQIRRIAEFFGMPREEMERLEREATLERSLQSFLDEILASLNATRPADIQGDLGFGVSPEGAFGLFYAERPGR